MLDQSDATAGMIGAMPQLTLHGGQYKTLSGGVRDGSPGVERRGSQDLETPSLPDTDAAAEAGGKRRGSGGSGGGGGGGGGGDGSGSAARGAVGAIGAQPAVDASRKDRLTPPRLGARRLNPGSSQSLSRLLAEAFSAINGEAASPAGASALGSAPPLLSFPPTRPTPPPSRHADRALSRSTSSRSADDVPSHAWSPDDAQMSAWLLQARRAAEEAKTARRGAARRGGGGGGGGNGGEAFEAFAGRSLCPDRGAG